ncbi:MAG: transcriptional repressor [Pseudomonadota bacterium]
MRTQGLHTQQEVLGVLEAAETPLTAYDILGTLKVGKPKLAPPTIYRALAALVEQGRAHRIESKNAFIACRGHAHDETAILTICDDCGSVDEKIDKDLIHRLGHVASDDGFRPRHHVIEVHGSCADCAEESK